MNSPKAHSTPIVLMMIAMDVVCAAMGLALVVVFQIGPNSIADNPAAGLAYWPWLFSFLVAWPLAALLCRLYISRRRDDLVSLVFDIGKAVAISLVFSGFIVAYFTALHRDPWFVLGFGVATLLFIAVFRISLQLALWSLRRRGHNESQILIVGINDRTKDLIGTILEHPYYGFRIIGILEDEPDRCTMIEEFDIPNLGKFDALEKVLTKHVIDEVYICLPVRSRYETIQSIAYLCEGVGVSVRMIADLFPLRIATSRFHKIENIPILALSTVPENQPQLILQRSTDLGIALLALLGLSPLLLGTALAIKLSSPGPVFFKQDRVGLNRRRFKMIKFRSMVADAEKLREKVEKLNQVEGPMFKAKNDPRITAVGRFIRKYSIDELPQLFNVLKGDMSLVGPRPPLPSEVNQYSWHQRRRLSVKPGMTGLSQISGRSELSFKDTVDLDLYYIDQWSLALVFRILFLTLPAVLRGRGAM